MPHLISRTAIDPRGLLLRWTMIFVVPVGITTLSGSASAQPPGVGGGPAINRPTTSPYLNLLSRRNRGGGSAALNYYRFVRPEQDLRRYSSQVGQSVTGLRQELTSQGLLPDGSRPLSGTGHATSFLNLGGYFPGAQSGARAPLRR